VAAFRWNVSLATKEANQRSAGTGSRGFAFRTPHHAAYVSINNGVAAISRQWFLFHIHESCGSHINDLLLSEMHTVTKTFFSKLNSRPLSAGSFTLAHTLFHNFTAPGLHYFPGDFNKKSLIFFSWPLKVLLSKKIFTLDQKKVDTMDHFLIEKTPAQLRWGILETRQSRHARCSVSHRQDLYSTAHTTLLRYHWLLQKIAKKEGNENLCLFFPLSVMNAISLRKTSRFAHTDVWNRVVLNVLFFYSFMVLVAAMSVCIIFAVHVMRDALRGGLWNPRKEV